MSETVDLGGGSGPVYEDSIPVRIDLAHEELPSNVSKLVDSFRTYLLKYAKQLMRKGDRRKQDESDMVQMTIIKGIERFDGFRGKSNAELATWLRQILQRQILSHQRQLSRSKEDISRERSLEDQQIEDQAPSVRQNIISDELKQKVRAAVVALPTHYREIVELHQFKKLSFVEIGQRLEKSPEAVRKTWSRAIFRLQAHLKSQLDSGGELPSEG